MQLSAHACTRGTLHRTRVDPGNRAATQPLCGGRVSDVTAQPPHQCTSAPGLPRSQGTLATAIIGANANRVYAGRCGKCNGRCSRRLRIHTLQSSVTLCAIGSAGPRVPLCSPREHAGTPGLRWLAGWLQHVHAHTMAEDPAGGSGLFRLPVVSDVPNATGRRAASTPARAEHRTRQLQP